MTNLEREMDNYGYDCVMDGFVNIQGERAIMIYKEEFAIGFTNEKTKSVTLFKWPINAKEPDVDEL